MAASVHPQGRGDGGGPSRLLRPLARISGLVVEALGSNDDYWSWVSEQRPSVDASYCALFLVGFYVIFMHNSPDMFSCPASNATLPGAPWAGPNPRLVCGLQRLLVGLHVVPVVAFFAPTWRWGGPSAAGGPTFYIRHVREGTFVLIRLLPAVMAVLGGGLKSCSGDKDPACTCQPSLLAWMCTYLLFTISYQVARQWQLALQVVSTACLWSLPSSGESMAARLTLIICAFVMPCFGACFLEAWVVNEYKVSLTNRKERGTRADNAETSNPTHPQSPTEKGASSESAEAQQESEVPQETGLVRQRWAVRQRGTVQEVPEENQAQIGRRDRVTVDLKKFLQEPLTDRGANFFSFNGKVSVQTKLIKVQTDDEKDKKELAKIAKVFSQRLAVKAARGRCTMVKAVVKRGCLLFIAEIAEPAEGQGSPKRDGTKDGKEDSRDLLECLPDDLQHLPMDVIFGETKATYENGKLKTYEAHDRCGTILEVPEVLLVEPVCMTQEIGPVNKLHVRMSKAKGLWDSLKLVVVYNDSIKGEVEMCMDNFQKDHRLEFTSEEEDAGAGYLHTIGAEHELGTFVGGLAPFLKLPGPAAAEMNDIFRQTVDALYANPNCIKSMGTSDGQSHDPCPVTVENHAWVNYFKPFALDMHYLLAPKPDELWRLMQKDDPQRDDYLRVFVNVVRFLEGSNATGTEQYLMSKFEEADVVLMNQDTKLSAGSLFPEQLVHCRFGLWYGFEDRSMECLYRNHFSQRQVLMDLAGMLMGICLLPMITILGEAGKCLYMCPLVLHLRLSLVCWIITQSTYISNREPIIMLSWGVRTLAWLGWVLNKDEMAEAALHPWATMIFLLWTVLVKTVVLKVPFSVHLTLSTVDTFICIVGFVVSTWCEAGWWTVAQGPIVLFSGYVMSLMISYYSEKSDREGFHFQKV